jgi:hypothetical protein
MPFGDAISYGSPSANLNAPVVGMTANPCGHGYWLVAADGGIFTYGDAGFFGSESGTTLAVAVVGMAATPDSHGYWLTTTAKALPPHAGSVRAVRMHQPGGRSGSRARQHRAGLRRR